MTVSWKTWLWRTFVTAAIIIIIAACFYTEENSRGVTAWRKCEREIAARGESLKWSDYIPAPVPDDQNFYKAPMMTAWFVKGAKSVSNAPSLILPVSNPQTSVDVITEISASNYVAWSAAFEPGFNLMRDAVNRPHARLDGDYTRPFKQPVPNFVSHRIVAQTLAHRARCYLLLGQPDKALADLTLLHKLNLTLVKDGQPDTLVTSMIHVATTGVYVNAMAYGIDAHAWRESDLAVLQKQLTEIDLLPEVAFSFNAERVGSCQVIETLTPGELMQAVSGSHRQVSDLGWWLLPGGWIQQNKAVIATLEEKIIESMDPTNRTVSPRKAVAAAHAAESEFRHTTPWNFIAAICIPNYTKAAETMARNQTWADQAQIACALERCRLADGKYPATLASLAPRFMDKLPHDIITGSPMSYRLKSDQEFVLYSIGWNELDDGGITAHQSDGKEDRENGDWVWQYPLP